MTIATDLGFKIGELYRVIENDNSICYSKGEIVKFVEDDYSYYPLFEYVSGPMTQATVHRWSDNKFYVSLGHLERLDKISSEPIKSSRELLKLYVKQHHPLDSTLIALVESI